MKTVLVMFSCAALLGSISVATAQSAATSAPHVTKTSDLMDANARMKKKKMKRGSMSQQGASGGMSGGPSESSTGYGSSPK